MSAKPKAETISVAETLRLLDGDFRAFADGVADGRYAFWLGSGISFGRFPSLKDIVVKVLEYLRGRVDLSQDDCPFKAGLGEAFGIANLTPDECQSIDLSVPVKEWAVVDSLRDQLSDRYALFLNIHIDGRESDFLIWDAVNVAETYGNEGVPPDVEHYVIAALVQEGLVTELLSANWDGLIEKAVKELSGGMGGLKVCVRSEDIREPDEKATLVKFHGCAVRAREEAETYRPYIVGAQSQIDRWMDDPQTQGLALHLTNVAFSKPTLMLGYSAQDANIRAVFSKAESAQSWAWPGDLPAYVMAEENIRSTQKALLENVYRDHFTGDNQASIIKSAHLQAFAKPLLTALLLWSYTAKLQRAARIGSFNLSDEMVEWVREGLVQLRDRIARASDGDHPKFVKTLLAGVSRTKRLFFVGKGDSGMGFYEPLTQNPVSRMDQDVESETNGLPEASVIVATLAKGAEADDWSLRAVEPDDDRRGTVQLVKDKRIDRIFIVGNLDAELALYESKAVSDDDDDAVLIHASRLPERLPRSPRQPPGRTGIVGPRRFSMRHLISGATPTELMERFRLEANI